MRRRGMKGLAIGLLLAFNWVVVTVHEATLAPPAVERLASYAPAPWYPRAEHGINQLVLEGDPYTRGVRAGLATASLLERQEQGLNDLLEEMIPYAIARYGLFLGLMRWFWGLDRYVEPWMIEEMYGVSQSASPKWNHLADPLTRQLAYHGLHEVGQFFSDVGAEGMGCTAFVLPQTGGWAVGRNFDFEGGRIFDEEKILKWVFPDKGVPYVSVIWAGMVGAVTGVNQAGVYVSINAAGSNDFRRFGTPSTLVALKALQFAESAAAARRIIEEATVFIADIYVVADKLEAYRIEKSPVAVRTEKLKGPTVIANHLEDPLWANDRINLFRKGALTSAARQARGEELLRTFAHQVTPVEWTLLGYLRDKKGVAGDRLHLGHRSAIDALIATHGVIYDSARGHLYVSQGPALVGPFPGFDLTASFASRSPVRFAELPPDPTVTPAQFEALKKELRELSETELWAEGGRCAEAKARWEKIPPLDHIQYPLTGAAVARCDQNPAEARRFYEAALAMKPAYAAQRRKIEEALK